MASIPFRFRAGGSGGPTVDSHHHRNTTKVSHKPFKSRHATKSLIKELAKGKVENTGWKESSRKPLSQKTMNKRERRNQAHQLRQMKEEKNAQSSSIFAGHNGAPRIVAVVPLCEDLDAVAAIQKLNKAVDAETIGTEPLEGPMEVRVDRFKQKLVYVPAERSLFPTLDACRLADFVLFLLSPMEEPGEEGELLIRTIEGQGVSNVLTLVQNLDTVDPPKRRPQVVSSLKSYITHFFPTQEKVLSLDSEAECANAIRSLCTTTPKGVKWRESRSWMLVENVQWPSSTSQGDANGEVVVTGVVRGKGLKANRLVQLGDWGHYQIEKVTGATLSIPLKGSKKRKAHEMAIDESMEGKVLEVPDEEQDDLAELAPYEATMGGVDGLSEAPSEKRGVLLDDHHYFSDDETYLPEAPKRLPKGTSSYQAAWFLGDMSDSGSDFEDAADVEEDFDMNSPALPQDGVEGFDQATMREPTEATPSEYLQSEMFLDPSPNHEATQLAEYRASRKTEAEEDLEFPDEVELHPYVLARERLARYRGLKSLKTSHWEASEDRAYEPEDWNRLLEVPNYQAAKKKVENEALVGGVQPGKRVHVHLRNVPMSLQQKYDPKRPLALYSLLRHEQKRSVVSFSITLSSDHPNPLRSKDELIIHCGPRRFVINPVCSQSGITSNNVHKFLRYLHPGQTAIASFIAPMTWGSVPALFFQPSANKTSMPLHLIATGTALAPSTKRVIAKRVILTGHPYKINKKLVTIRYMFFNKEDVDWFKALQLWTKRGRSGFIKESLGTHGYFKATFDGRINPQDAVGMSLYKRVWPREARPWKEGEAVNVVGGEGEADGMVEE
ncbi:hypothetical protein MMC28_003911 [Mycoblastus sanguinarius]|nr:hypothetical protein [Mycoblastus sanguinarius]